MSFKHGAARYRGRKGSRCRCEDCRKDSTERARLERIARAQRLALDPTLADHGNANTFTNWGCRCAECTQANSERCREYKRKRKAGAR